MSFTLFFRNENGITGLIIDVPLLMGFLIKFMCAVSCL